MSRAATAQRTDRAISPKVEHAMCERENRSAKTAKVSFALLARRVGHSSPNSVLFLKRFKRFVYEEEAENEAKGRPSWSGG